MISVESLSKRYGKTVAVDDLSFEVRAGSMLGFLGPNGAGKTTTLRVLLGLARPTSGRATIDGHPYASLRDPVGTVGAVLDSSGFHPGRTGRNHLRVIARAAGLPRSRVEEMLRMVELEGAAGRRVKGYSLGMKQRLNLAGALLGDPAGAGPRRARQRPRPAGDPLAARLPPLAARPRGARCSSPATCWPRWRRPSTRSS